MKHLISIICVLLGCINITKAQVVISTSDLIGTKWQTPKQYDMQSKEYDEYTLEQRIWHMADGTTFAYPYYLSNTIPTKFDYSKVGKSTKGCYLIEVNPKWGWLYCYSIISFNKTEGNMVLQNGDDIPDIFILIPSKKQRNQYKDPPISSNW